MPDRLSELQRQRDLVLQHLHWLEGEIKTEASRAGKVYSRSDDNYIAPAADAGNYLAGQAAAILRTTPPEPVPVPSAAVAMESPAVNAAADAIMSEYQVKPDALKSDIRKGCFVYFFIALAVFAAGVAILYIVLPSSPPPQ